jgi:hypothetical protein
MAKQRWVTAEDRAEVVRVALEGIADGLELGKITARLGAAAPEEQHVPR